MPINRVRTVSIRDNGLSRMDWKSMKLLCVYRSICVSVSLSFGELIDRSILHIYVFSFALYFGSTLINQRIFYILWCWWSELNWRFDYDVFSVWNGLYPKINSVLIWVTLQWTRWVDEWCFLFHLWMMRSLAVLGDLIYVDIFVDVGLV